MRTVLLLIALLLPTQTGPLDAARQVASLRNELASLVTDTGAAKAGRSDRLDQLAARCGQTAEKATDPAVRLEACLIQAQAYHALAQSEVERGRTSLTIMRLGQLRTAANAARQLDTPGAVAVGDYWLLMADLVDTQRNARTLAEAQIGAIAQMERFCSMHNEDAAGSPVLAAVKFELMRLCDQAGDNGRAMALLNELYDPAQADETDERTAIFAGVSENAQLVNQPLDPALRRQVPGRWRLLLIHDPANAQAMRDAAAQLEKTFAGDEQGLTIALLPVERTELGDGLAQGLSSALPRYVLVDPTGVIRAVGHTPAVAERYTALTSPPPRQDDAEPIQ